MKKKTGTFTRIAVIALAEIFALTLAGCATTGGSETPPAPDKQVEDAAQLTADLNAMNEGCARVSGDTVTLTKGTGVQKNLTVPAGITLEITGDGGIWLNNGITLTVNGTVNAPSNRIGPDGSAHSVAATINGSGTIKLLSKGNLIGFGGANKKLTLDGVTLVGIADNDSQLVWVGDGGELILKSGVITGNTSTSGFTGGVHIGEKSTFTMKSGAITGNEGRGVFVNGKTATFIMEGGDISGNGCGPGADGGQGVAVNEGIFIMKSGAIYGNAFTSREGGGVFIVGDALFEMHGGRIQGNKDSDGFTRNINRHPKGRHAALQNTMSRTKWGTGGTYTIGGVPQTGGGEIAPLRNDGFGGTDDTLIAIPAK